MAGGTGGYGGILGSGSGFGVGEGLGPGAGLGLSPFVGRLSGVASACVRRREVGGLRNLGYRTWGLALSRSCRSGIGSRKSASGRGLHCRL